MDDGIVTRDGVPFVYWRGEWRRADRPAGRVRRRYSNRGIRQKLYPVPGSPLPRWGSQTREQRTLLLVTYDHIGRFPRLPADIFRQVLDDFGDCCERRLWRALATLVKLGLVEREGPPMTTDGGYRRAR